MHASSHGCAWNITNRSTDKTHPGGKPKSSLNGFSFVLRHSHLVLLVSICAESNSLSSNDLLLSSQKSPKHMLSRQKQSSSLAFCIGCSDIMHTYGHPCVWTWSLFWAIHSMHRCLITVHHSRFNLGSHSSQSHLAGISIMAHLSIISKFPNRLFQGPCPLCLRSLGTLYIHRKQQSLPLGCLKQSSCLSGVGPGNSVPGRVQWDFLEPFIGSPRWIVFCLDFPHIEILPDAHEPPGLWKAHKLPHHAKVIILGEDPWRLKQKTGTVSNVL